MAERPLHTFQVVSTTRFAPHMVRVVLGGGGFDTFTPSDFTDSYVKFVFIHPDVDVTNLPLPLHLASLSGLPPHHRPTVRTGFLGGASPIIGPTCGERLKAWSTSWFYRASRARSWLCVCLTAMCIRTNWW